MNEKLREKIKTFPEEPGVYLMRGEKGEVIYVGKAKALRKRVQSYFLGKDESPKTQAMMEEVQDIETITVRSESEALILEYRFIKEHRPKYNVRLKDDKRYPLVRVSVQEPMPRITVVRVAKDDGARYFGRYTDAGALRRTLDLLHKIFRYRDCHPRLPTRKDWKHCMTYKLGLCVAPCIGEVTHDEYRRIIDEICLFLEGKSRQLIDVLETRMKEAARHQEFEKAAEIRDNIDAVKKVLSTRKTEIPLFRRRLDEAESEMRELKVALKMEAFPRVIEAFDISNIMGKQSVGSMVYFENGYPNKNHYRRFKIKTVEGINDFAMMQEVVRRRYSRLVEERKPLPDLILIDGGKGQLSAALGILWELGLQNRAVVGLAKRYEELFLPHRSEPVVLPRTSRALKLVQRVRDEAHRFAIAYHKLLRQKRIKESILDDIERIGERRKLALLKHFGSIEKIRKASVEKIAAVENIGSSLAQIIHESLQ